MGGHRWWEDSVAVWAALIGASPPPHGLDDPPPRPTGKQRRDWHLGYPRQRVGTIYQERGAQGPQSIGQSLDINR
jgi:hypothetical protein